jgi:hypothetical protein
MKAKIPPPEEPPLPLEREPEPLKPPPAPSSARVVDNDVLSQEGMGFRYLQVEDDFLPCRWQHAANHRRAQPPILYLPYLLTGTKLFHRQETPIQKTYGVVFRGKEDAAVRFYPQHLASRQQEAFDRRPCDTALLIDSEKLVPWRKGFDSHFATGGGDPCSPRKTPSAFVVNHYFAGEKSIRMIGLEIIDRNSLTNSQDGVNPLLRQGLTIPGEYHISRTKGFDGLECAVAHIERVVRGHPERRPVRLEENIFIYLMLDDLTDLRRDHASFRIIRQKLVTRTQCADRGL